MNVRVFAQAVAALLVVAAFASSGMAQTLGRGTTTGTTTGGTTTGTTGNTLGGQSGSRNQTTGAGGTEAIGRDADRTFSDAGATTGNVGVGGLGGLRGLGGLGGFGGLGAFGSNLFGNNNLNSSQTKPTVRTRLRSEIELPTQAATVLQSNAQRQVTRSYSQPRFQGVGAAVNGSTAVITGTVASDRDRRMAELLMRLEPGVSRIENRITVAP